MNDDRFAQVRTDPRIRRIIDTRAWDDIPGIGRIDDGVLTSYHVTDTPEKVFAFLRRRGNLVAAYGPRGEHAELGPGLYLSGVPEYWVSRSRGKWSFLGKLSLEKGAALCAQLSQDLARLRERGYVSRNEHDHGQDVIAQVLAGKQEPEILTTVAGQPYNISFWKPEYLRPLGIDPAPKPRALKVGIRGVLAELQSTLHDPALFRRLRHLGVDGVYVRSSFASNPELCLWSSRAIVGAAVEEI